MKLNFLTGRTIFQQGENCTEKHIKHKENISSIWKEEYEICFLLKGAGRQTASDGRHRTTFTPWIHF